MIWFEKHVNQISKNAIFLKTTNVYNNYLKDMEMNFFLSLKWYDLKHMKI
jgi:hypothetical protein